MLPIRFPTSYRSWSTAAVAAALAALLSASGCTPTDNASATRPGGAGSARHAWTMDGTGRAGTGGVDLEMSGTFEAEGDSVSFDGGSGAAATAAPGPVDTTGDFTVAAWVNLRPTLLGDGEYPVAVSQLGSTAAAFYLGVAEGRWSFGMKDSDTNDPGHTIRAQGPPAASDAETWVHLAGVHDAGAGRISLYLDGRPVAQTPFDGAWRARGPLTVGRSQAQGTPSDFWPGAIADVRSFSTTLSASQVSRLTERTRPVDAPPPAPAVPAGADVLNGTYAYRLTSRESRRLEQLFGPEAAAAGFPGDASIIIGFLDGRWQLYVTVDGRPYLLDGKPEGDGGTYAVNRREVVLSNGHSPDATYRWSRLKNTLTLALKDYSDAAEIDTVRFMTEHRYRRVTP